ncbi:hypothetical protein P3T22_002300 [Paraburkholderia sp. GAS348]
MDRNEREGSGRSKTVRARRMSEESLASANSDQQSFESASS